MRVVRFETPGGERWLGRVETQSGHDVVVPLLAQRQLPGHDPLREALVMGIDLAGALPAEAVLELATVRLLAPTASPSKVVAIGLNYADHAKESGAAIPERPMVFTKFPNSIVGPGENIVWREDASRQVDYEAELAVVVGRLARDVARDEALDHVFGYTCLNDVSARDAQFADGQWVRGKSFDTFCPIGPWIVSRDQLPDPQVLRVQMRLNGETLQDGTTSDMIFGVAELVAYLSRVMTLEPGDVIATGTPFGVGFARDPQVFLGDGDVCEVDIEGIGVLRNTCRVSG